MNTAIFDAIKKGDLSALQAQLVLKPDLTQKDSYGFTPLHRAASASNILDEVTSVALLTALIQAKSPIELTSEDGRTALYLAAEFSNSLAPLQVLINAGANANISDKFGNHIVENAMMEEVQRYLSNLTGHPMPIAPLELDNVKLSTSDWKAAKTHLDAVFAQISQSSILVLQNAGTTQEDGFSDCSELMQTKISQGERVLGFCFYTSQDLSRAKRTSKLSLAFWGAPDGDDEASLSVAKIITDAFTQYPFIVDWTGSVKSRPMIYLQKIK
jgi:hypothetical protein